MKQFFITLVLSFCTFWSFNLKDPHLLFIRPFETALLVFLLLASLFLCSKYFLKLYKKIALLIVLSLLILVLVQEARFQWYKYQINNNASVWQKKINQRLIIGFAKFEDIQILVLNDIAGIFISQRNIQGKSYTQIQSAIKQLQNLRLSAGLKPLIIATDQEGGIVSRLSPLITKQPPLSSLVSKQNAEELAYQYGNDQGKQLDDLGINTNFSPVVDLKPSEAIGSLDFHSLIHKRAISADPKIVTKIALSYVKGLQHAGVNATLKHFPGLREVKADTHHFSTQLTTSISELNQQDWQPFKVIGKKTNAWIMLAHVVLPELDAKEPVSTSKIVIDEILRKQFNYKGILITDDLTMGATYNRGFCQSSISALATDLDYLLIAYDYEKYFNLVMCIEEPT